MKKILLFFVLSTAALSVSAQSANATASEQQPAVIQKLSDLKNAVAGLAKQASNPVLVEVFTNFMKADTTLMSSLAVNPSNNFLDNLDTSKNPPVIRGTNVKITGNTFNVIAAYVNQMTKSSSPQDAAGALITFFNKGTKKIGLLYAAGQAGGKTNVENTLNAFDAAMGKIDLTQPITDHTFFQDLDTAAKSNGITDLKKDENTFSTTTLLPTPTDPSVGGIWTNSAIDISGNGKAQKQNGSSTFSPQ